MGQQVQWRFEADYMTVCNCDWGCPCNFNARPTQGECHGLGVWRISRGHFGATPLHGVSFAGALWWPGLIEHGNGIARYYVDDRTTPAQREAIEAISSGCHGGGSFEVFAATMATVHPLQVARIDFHVDGARSWFRVADVAEARSEPLTYPDGSVIEPRVLLPHGIEYKDGLMTNARRWWMRDRDLLAAHENRYCAVSTVSFSNEGCLA